MSNDSVIVDTLDVPVDIRLDDFVIEEKMLSKLIDYHGYKYKAFPPIARTLEERDKLPDNYRKLQDSHYNIRKTYRVKLKIDVYSDGTLKLAK